MIFFSPRRQILNIVIIPSLLVASLLIALLHDFAHPLLSIAYAIMLLEGLFSVAKFDNNSSSIGDDFRFRWGSYAFRIKYLIALSFAFILASFAYPFIGSVIAYLFAIVFVFYRLWLFESMSAFQEISSSNAPSVEVISLGGNAVSASREANISLFKDVLALYVKEEPLRRQLFSDCQFSSFLSTDKANRELIFLLDQYDSTTDSSKFLDFIALLKGSEIA